jgi:hypothetical protein
MATATTYVSGVGVFHIKTGSGISQSRPAHKTACGALLRACTVVTQDPSALPICPLCLKPRAKASASTKAKG